MVRFIHAAAGNHLGDHLYSIPIGIGLFVVASAVVALCANHARRRASRKQSKDGDKFDERFDSGDQLEDCYQEKFPPRSPLRSPKQLITTTSNKAMKSLLVNHKRVGGGGDGRVVEEGFGEGGLWQKEILMGEKCQPPEFSGVIYYNCDGRQISEFPPRSPRSPRVTPSSEFSFPVIRVSN